MTSSSPRSAADLDRSLRGARVDRRRGTVTYPTCFGDLPDGALFVADEGTFLKWQGTARPWSLDGTGRRSSGRRGARSRC
ncbi:hypothetical protein [Reyranella sp.]|uniref:hypothetical protein n=1 Tax=Reyranella sp. TaxID=1929291 RepID=UPI004036F47B